METAARAGGQKSAVKGKRENREKKKKSAKNFASFKESSGAASVADTPPSPDTEAPLSSKADAKTHKVSNSPVGGGSGSHDIDPTSYMLAEEGGVALGGASQHLLNIQAAFTGK